MATRMECPQCNARVREMSAPDGGRLFYCGVCGWGQQATHASQPSEPVGTPWGWLILGWLWTLTLVLGPYAFLLVWLPQQTGDPVAVWIHMTYWMVMAIYLMAAATVDPSFDRSNMGWAGGMIDNPFSFEDDMNRAGLFWALALLPGKAACWTIAQTFGAVRGR